jgi:hypothetical protein
MTGTSRDWSPADNPHAIAISEAQWWQRAVRLAVLRLRDPDDRRISWFSSRQIDARQLVFALRQILNAERLVAAALEQGGVNAAARDALDQARLAFEDALPDIKHMRDALMHFDEWSRGEGRGPQKDQVRSGDALRDVARDYWGFGYDPSTGIVSLGSFTIHVDAADQAADQLSRAIYFAAREVDKKNAGELHTRTAEILTHAGISCASISSEDVSAWLRVKEDSRVWLSLAAAQSSDPERRKLSEQIVDVLANVGLTLSSITEAENLTATERLLRGEALFVQQEAGSEPRG